MRMRLVWCDSIITFLNAFVEKVHFMTGYCSRYAIDENTGCSFSSALNT